MLNFIPACPRRLIEGAYNFIRPAQDNTESAVIATHFFHNAMQVAVAAGICFAAYKGSTVAVVLLTTVSLPATMIAGGITVLKYGCTALKIEALHKGLPLLFVGWFMLSNAENFNKVGLLDSQMRSLSIKFILWLGYTVLG